MLVLSVALGIAAFIVARDTTIDVLSGADEDRSAPVVRQPDPVGSVPDAAPVVVPRVPVSSGELAWTMRAEPQRQELSVPTPGGGTIPGTVWSADVTSSAGMSGDLAVIYQLDGRPFSLEGGLDGAVAGNSGVVLEGPNPVTVAGTPGQMITATYERGGVSGIVRYAGAQFGDRVLVLGVVDEGTSRTVGQQRFADIVASVRVS